MIVGESSAYCVKQKRKLARTRGRIATKEAVCTKFGAWAARRLEKKRWKIRTRKMRNNTKRED